MKQILRVIALLLAVVTLGAAFAACSKITDSETTDTAGATDTTDKNGTADATDSKNDSEKNTDKSTEKLPDNIYLLFQNGEYKIKAIMPDRPTDIENTVYAKLRAKIKSKTGKTLQTNTDYLKSGETHSKNEPEILVGLTNYSESINLYEDITEGTYGIKISGKKIIFYFSTLEEGIALVDAFASAIRSNDDKAFWISNKFSVSKKETFKLEDIPSYPSTTKKYNCYDDTTMLIADSTNLTNYKKYCETLISKGFTEYSKRDNVNGNYFRTYTKGTMALTVYFNKGNNTVRIISGPLSDIPAKNTTSAKETNKTPSVTLLNQGTKSNGAQQGSGLGMIFHLPNGKFIIYDGGYTANDGLYKKLKELAGKDEIIIAAWIISHPHHDHEEAFDAFVKKHANDVRLENVMFNYTNLVEPNPLYSANSDTIRNNIKTYLDGKTNIIKPHTGQIYSFGSSTVEILYTVEDLIPNTSGDINDSSLVVRITMSDKSILLLGDALEKTAKSLTSTYGSYLKSDMVQLAHHGTNPGTKDLYTNINATVLFWPSSTDNVKQRYYTDKNAAVVEAVSKAKDIYLAGEGSATLMLPYTYKNNKSAFLNRVK